MIKIFDATTVIAFLTEMDYPEGMIKLSKRYEILVPPGVQKEITKSPGKEILQDMIKQGVVKLAGVDQEAVDVITAEYPQLGRGECEVVVFMQMHPDIKKMDCAVSDDLKARKLFPDLNFKGTERLLDIMVEEGLLDGDAHASARAKLDQSTFYTIRGKS